jgi:hypothetical protein
MDQNDAKPWYIFDGMDTERVEEGLIWSSFSTCRRHRPGAISTVWTASVPAASCPSVTTSSA